MSAGTAHALQQAGACIDCSTRLRSAGSVSGMTMTPAPCAEHSVTGSRSNLATAACASGISVAANR